MKNLTIMLALLFSIASHAQDCNSYFPMKKGTEMEITSFNKKDKKTGRSYMKVLDKKAMGNAMIAEMETTVYDKNAEQRATNNYTVKCENGVLYFDMSQFVPDETLEAYKDMDVTMDGSQLELPANAKVGDMLGNGTINIKVKNQGIQLVNLTIDITDRKVLTEEKVTTTAGTFDCIKISYNVKTDMGMMKFTTSVIEWHAKNVGMVKSESYNKKGEFTSKSELTSFKN